MEEKIRCAQVAVEKALPSFDRLFDYLVPDHMDLKPGCRVLVPFGSGGPRVGMVFSMDPPERREGLKPILRQLDSQPCLEEKQLALAAFLQERTFCTWFDAVRLLLPLGVSLQVSLCYTPLEKERLKEVSGGLAPVAGLLARTRKGVTPAAAAKALEVGEDTALSSLEELCRMGLAQKETVARRRLGEETAVMVRLNPDFSGEGGTTEKQRQALELLEQAGEASLKELTYYCGCTRSVPETLEKKGAVVFFEKKLPLAAPLEEPEAAESLDSLRLSPRQRPGAGGFVGTVFGGGAPLGFAVRHYRERENRRFFKAHRQGAGTWERRHPADSGDLSQPADRLFVPPVFWPQGGGDAQRALFRGAAGGI